LDVLPGVITSREEGDERKRERLLHENSFYTQKNAGTCRPAFPALLLSLSISHFPGTGNCLHSQVTISKEKRYPFYSDIHSQFLFSAATKGVLGTNREELYYSLFPFEKERMIIVMFSSPPASIAIRASFSHACPGGKVDTTWAI
jgi:hypothetical protein